MDVDEVDGGELKIKGRAAAEKRKNTHEDESDEKDVSNDVCIRVLDADFEFR
jgi:hypothetical protein